jgi:hypothetical protein
MAGQIREEREREGKRGDRVERRGGEKKGGGQMRGGGERERW